MVRCQKSNSKVEMPDVNGTSKATLDGEAKAASVPPQSKPDRAQAALRTGNPAAAHLKSEPPKCHNRLVVRPENCKIGVIQQPEHARKLYSNGTYYERKNPRQMARFCLRIDVIVGRANGPFSEHRPGQR